MNFDKVEIKILEDGRIKVETDSISQPNHLNADKLLDFISQLMGGEVIREKKKHSHVHQSKKQTLSQNS